MAELLIAVLAAQIINIGLIVSVHTRIGNLEGYRDATKARFKTIESRVALIENRN